jgi:hypothetical protein
MLESAAAHLYELRLCIFSPNVFGVSDAFYVVLLTFSCDMRNMPRLLLLLLPPPLLRVAAAASYMPACSMCKQELSTGHPAQFEGAEETGQQACMWY